jgi:hypothetical protein
MIITNSRSKSTLKVIAIKKNRDEGVLFKVESVKEYFKWRYGVCEPDLSWTDRFRMFRMGEYKIVRAYNAALQVHLF